MSKKIGGLFLISLLLIGLTTALGETDAARKAIEGARPGYAIAQMEQAGETAAALLTQGEEKALVMAERQGQDWQITANNETLFLPDAPLPRLSLTEKELALDLGEEHRFIFQKDNGAWHFDREEARNTYGPVKLVWSREKGGFFQRWVTPYNQTALSPGKIFPAPWLADAMTLASFDVSRYPLGMEYTDFEDDWPRKEALAAMTEYVRPGYQLEGGSGLGFDSLDQTLYQLLCRRPDEKIVLLGLRFDGEIRVQESTPLPEGTYYGVENFNTSMQISGACVTVSYYPAADTWGLSHIIRYKGPEDYKELYFGPMSVKNFDYYWDNCWFGSHPWQDMRTMDWSSLPHTLQEAIDAMDTAGWALVCNPSPQDRLNLRTGPGRDYESLGKYYTGTPVRILKTKGDWAQVDIFGVQGWMMKKFLHDQPPLQIEYSIFPQKIPQGEQVEIRHPVTGQSYFAGRMQVIGVMQDGTYHIWSPENGGSGMIKQDLVWDGNG